MFKKNLKAYATCLMAHIISNITFLKMEKLSVLYINHTKRFKFFDRYMIVKNRRNRLKIEETG